MKLDTGNEMFTGPGSVAPETPLHINKDKQISAEERTVECKHHNIVYDFRYDDGKFQEWWACEDCDETLYPEAELKAHGESEYQRGLRDAIEVAMAITEGDETVWLAKQFANKIEALLEAK